MVMVRVRIIISGLWAITNTLSDSRDCIFFILVGVDSSRQLGKDGGHRVGDVRGSLITREFVFLRTKEPKRRKRI